jgi:tetratricopeptide (TPR) repeat protein
MDGKNKSRWALNTKGFCMKKAVCVFATICAVLVLGLAGCGSISEPTVFEPASDAGSRDSAAEKAVNAYKRGEAYYQKNDFDKAIAEYNEAIRLAPGYADAYLGRGQAYAWKSEADLVQARTDYDEAAKFDSKYAGFARAFGYYQDQEYDSAIDEYTQVIESKINLVEAYSCRGNVYTALGDFDHAIDDHTEGIRLNPQFYGEYVNRGYSYLQIGELDKALADFNQAIQLGSDQWAVYFLRGQVYFAKENYSRAGADFNQAINLNSKSAMSYLGRGTVYWFEGDIDKAVSDLTEAIRLEPDFLDAYLCRGYIYEMAKEEYDKAIADYNEALRIDPDNEEARAMRRQVQAKLPAQ